MWQLYLVAPLFMLITKWQENALLAIWDGHPDKVLIKPDPIWGYFCISDQNLILSTFGDMQQWSLAKSPNSVRTMSSWKYKKNDDTSHGVPSVNQKSNEEDSSSDMSRSSLSSSTSCGSSSRSSSSSPFSSAVGSDGSKPMPECAAGKKCPAPTESGHANSPYNCWGCNKKIHSALLCGSSISDLIFKNPSVAGMRLLVI